MRRDGVNRRQVNQVLKAIKDGGSVRDIAGAFNVEHQVVFNFAKKAGIKLKETPESVALQKHDALIESEVSRRMNERLAMGGSPKAKMELSQPKTPIKRGA